MQRRLPIFHPFYLAGYALAGICLIPIIHLVGSAAGGELAILEKLWRPRTAQTLGTSFALVTVVTIVDILLGVGTAWLTTRVALPGRRLWCVLFALPLVFPSYIATFAVVAALSPNGLLGGLNIRFTGFWAACWVLALYTWPYVFLLVRASLLRLDTRQEEAARSLGDSPWQVFVRITFPQLRPAIIAGALLAGLYVLSDFGAVYLLQVDTLTQQVYAHHLYSPATSAAYALVLVVITLILVVLGVGRRPASASARNMPPIKPTAPGPWTLPLLLVCTGLCLLTLALPLTTIIHWLIRGIALGEPLLQKPWLATNSLLLSGLAALLAIALAILPAALTVRYPGKRSRWIDRSVYLSYAIPGVVLGFAFLRLGLGSPLYQSLFLLIVACAIHFLPQASGIAGSSLAQIHPHLYEAGRSLGDGRWQALRRIILPLAAPGLLAGAALVFLTCMKELPLTLILRPTGFDTLATQIWTDTDEGFFSRAALPSLMLVGFSGISVALILRRQQV